MSFQGLTLSCFGFPRQSIHLFIGHYYCSLFDDDHFESTH